MNSKSRQWFDLAYQFCGGFLPFGIITQCLEDRDIEPLRTKINLDKKLLEHIKYASKRFSSSLPSEADFIEEKKRLYPSLALNLKQTFPYAKEIYAFGRNIGDIDLLMISQISTSRIESDIQKNPRLLEKFPIVDWESLLFFNMPSLNNFYSRLYESRIKATGLKVLPPSELEYISETMSEFKELI